MANQPITRQGDAPRSPGRTSIAQPLIFVYGLLVLIVLAGAVFSTVALVQIHAPVNHAQQSALTVAASINALREQTGRLGRQLATRNARANAAQHYDEIADYNRTSEELIGRLGVTANLTVKPLLDARSAVSKDAVAIAEIEMALAASLARLAESEALIKSEVAEATRLIGEHAARSFDQRSESLRDLPELRFHLSTLALHATAAGAARNQTALDKARQLYVTNLQHSVSLFSRLPDYPAKPTLDAALDQLLAAGQEEDRLFERASQVIEHEQEIARLVSQFLDQLEAFEGELSLIARSNNDAMIQTLVSASRILTRRQYMIIGATLFSIVLGVFVLRRYVFDAVIKRLRQLQEVTLRLSSGDLDAPLDTKGNDEITDVNRALEVFRDNARSRAKSERALALRTEQLEQVNQELDEFAYIASHDLRSPLNGVDSLATFLQEDLAEVMPDESARHVELIRSRISRLQGLLDSLLQYSRVGRDQHKLERVDVDELIRDNASLLERTGFEFDYDLQVGNAAVLATPLSQVVRNLVDNAIKHHDRKNGRVEISAHRDNGFISLTVRDDGAGIDPAFHDRIFGMFQTLKARDSTEGSGMGLTFLRKTVARNGGRIELESDPAKQRGTSFSVRWPLSDADQAR